MAVAGNHRLPVDDSARACCGILHRDDGVELIDGEIRNIAPIGRTLRSPAAAGGQSTPSR